MYVDPNGNDWWNPFSWFDNVSNIGKIIIGVVAFIGAVALTIATGGALAPMFITLGISLASGTLICGFGAVISSGGDWSQFGKGAFDGFSDGMLWGGIFALGGAAIRTMRILKRGVVIGESMSRVDAAPQAFVCGAFRCRSGAVILLAIFLQRKGTEQQCSVPLVKEDTPLLRHKKCACFRSFGRGTKRKQTPSDSTPARLRASRRL